MTTNIFLMKKNNKTIEIANKTTNNIYIKKAEDINKHIKKTNKTEINVYDKTKKQKKGEEKKIRVNNHINKTGENPLISKKETKINFYDITEMYHKKKEGVTTVCLGKRYKKEQKKFKYPSSTLCHVVFILRSKGYKKINGWLIPEN